MFGIRKGKKKEIKILIDEMKKQKIPKSEWNAVKIALEKEQYTELLQDLPKA